MYMLVKHLGLVQKTPTLLLYRKFVYLNGTGLLQHHWFLMQSAGFGFIIGFFCDLYLYNSKCTDAQLTPFN